MELVDLKLLRLKIHYLVHGMGGSPIVPFGPLIGRQLGVSSAGMGFIFAIIPICGIITKPIISGIADKYGIKKQIYLLLMLICMASYSSLQKLPPLPHTSISQVECSDSSYMKIEGKKDGCLTEKLSALYSTSSVDCTLTCHFREKTAASQAKSQFSGSDFSNNPVELTGNGRSLKVKTWMSPGLASSYRDQLQIPLAINCSHLLKLSCAVDCPLEPDLTRILNQPQDAESSGSFSGMNNHQYYLFLVIFTLAQLSFGTMCNFQESICHEILGDQGEAKYGEQRLWASIGWGGMAALVGYMVDRDKNLLSDYSIAAYIMLICWTLDFFIIQGIRFPEKKGVSSNPWMDVGRLLCTTRILVFLFWCALVGVGLGAMGFHFWFLEDLADTRNCADSKNIKLLQGLCLTFNCLGEIPVFFVSGKLLKKYNNRLLMAFVVLSHSMRMIFYSYINSPWQALPAELLQGVTFGLFFPVLVSFSGQIAPPGTQTLMTTLAFIVFDGVGLSIGGWASGLLYQSVGGSWTYWYFGLFLIFVTAIHQAALNYLEGEMEQNKKYNKIAQL